jgi:PPM family protein phosphatase
MDQTKSMQDTLPLQELAEPAPTGSGTVRVKYGVQSHIGKVRKNNEDQYLVARARKSLDILATGLTEEQTEPLLERDGYILLVADGVGGSAGGEHASAVVVNEAIRHIMETAKWFFRVDDPDEGVRLRLLQETLDRADRRLQDEAKADPTLAGMGTTLTAANIVAGGAFIVHVGDSRAYLFRDGYLEQLTTDHTLVQQFVTAGLLEPEAARTHRLRHVITNVVGGAPGVEGEMVSIRLKDRDRLLLSTDGLHDPVPDERIAELLLRHADPQEACRALVQAALDNGGPDNVTAIVADCAFEGHRTGGQ